MFPYIRFTKSDAKSTHGILCPVEMKGCGLTKHLRFTTVICEHFYSPQNKGSVFICHGESTRNSRFVDTNVRGPKARVHLYYESTVPSAFSDLKYCIIVL